jgi:hypothetical protein
MTLLFFTCFSLVTESGEPSFGEAEKINDDWKFYKGDPKEASSPGFDDSRWRTLDLPHDWSVEGPYSPSLASATGYLPGGIERWPSRGFTSGLIDLAGYKKPRAFFRESLWSERPMIYSGTFRKTRSPRYSAIDAPPLWNYQEGDSVTVVCYTNCEQARLFLNGREVGNVKSRDDNSGTISWNVANAPGKLETVGYAGGKESLRHTLGTSSRPHAIKAVPVKNFISFNNGTALVNIFIVDENGKPVYLSDNEITCTTIGPVKLLGLEVSDPTDMGNYSDNRQRVFEGKITAYIQASGDKGTATVRFTSPWLESAEITLAVE